MPEATEPKTSVQILMNKTYENKIFIAIIIACILGAWNVIVSSIQQPLVDDHQNFMIELNTANVVQINGKLDEILRNMPKH